MTRKDFVTIADSFVATYRVAVEPFQQPAAYGIRRHAWRETVKCTAATVKANHANFDLARFYNYITNNAGLEPGLFVEE